MPIRVLDQKTVSRIAAGEVVERPASAVKELVENSLDAGSTQITVEAMGGGVNLIRVTDNGCGISSGELEFAFQRHATSKITSVDDLENISSLGFRGEALPSIAAVAQVAAVSCATGEPTGSHLSLNEGIIVNQGSQGHPQGTTITVRHLFRNLPARLKFLKSPATENRHLADVVSQYALAFPEVKFTLSLDGKTSLRTPGSSQLIDSVAQVYGSEIARHMLELRGEIGRWGGETATSLPRVSGMTGSPSISRSHRGYLSFFVNRRWINSRLLTWAVEEGYHGLLMSGKHPVAIINISISPKELDVNIHPTKTEVKFQNERLIFATVQKAVRQTLIASAPVPQIEEVTTSFAAPPATGQPLLAPDQTHHPASLPLATQPTPAFSLPALRLLGQLANSYIIAEGPDGLYVIDQHAAHERILFENIKRQNQQPAVEVQGLLEPATLEVTPQQETVLKSHAEILSEFGFSIEPFGNRTYLVRAIPALLHQNDWAEVLRELLDFPLADRGDWTEKMAISLACHGAVRAGQALTDEAMRELIRQLEQAALPNTCPHGRPSMIRFSSGRLAREFGRS